jgi:hypothetical protein
MRFTWLDSKSLILKSREELITSLVAATAPGHRERNIISVAGNNSSLSHHLITECQIREDSGHSISCFGRRS